MLDERGALLGGTGQPGFQRAGPGLPGASAGLPCDVTVASHTGVPSGVHGLTAQRAGGPPGGADLQRLVHQGL